MASADLIAKAKLAARIKTTAFDSQIAMLLDAAYMDMVVAGVVIPAEENLLIEQAAITYCMMYFGQPDEYARLKASYDEQKGQLATNTGTTDWGGIDG